MVRVARCKACGKEFVKKQNKQQYCCDDCRDVALKQQWRNASHKYYHKHKYEWGSTRRYGLGTGTLGPHPNVDDFDCEMLTVKKELVRLRLKS